jgi:glycosyltransferase involved in cell wall biosynthesis
MKVVLFANTDWYLYNFRLPLALALRDAGYELLLISPPGPYGDRLRDQGFRWEPLPMHRRSLNPIRELGLLWHLWRLFRRERPTVVHGFTIKSAVYGALAARLAGVPARISAVAGMGYVYTNDDLKARLLRPFVRLLMRVALNGENARLILQNKDDVALFETAGIVDPSRIRLIRGSGVDCGKFKPRDTAIDATGSLKVLLASRLLWDKGLAEYAEASRILQSNGRTVQFLLAGDPDPGNPASVPEKRIREWEADGLIDWLGHVDDMPKLLASVDLVVLPSYREGLPKSLIEAAACGLPLVATDVAGCREVIIDGEDGLLVPARDTAALADAIRRLDDDRELAQRLGLAAREKTLASFDEEIVIRQTIEVYDELLSATRPIE